MIAAKVGSAPVLPRFYARIVGENGQFPHFAIFQFYLHPCFARFLSRPEGILGL
jgi:hypothetical protein